ncbi:hypothetical protein L6R52_20400 [Myxococcota bacterium]|nr:hypothetical protein [Myxococcota bacterium]
MRWHLAPALALGLGLVAGAPAAASAARVHGAVIDDTAKKVGEDRFKSTEDWDKTIRFFRSAYGGKPGIVWRVVDTPPKVRAIHIENTAPKRTWEGINIYETGGEIFIFVIKAVDTGG